jgi:hypothetical protein
MNAPVVAATQEGPATARWLLLIHQLPPKPDYLRVKVRRRLQRIGAVALKNTVYILRNDAESVEDFMWVVREIEADGGTAMVCEASFIEGITDEEIDAMFDAARTESPRTNPQRARERVTPGQTWVTRAGVHVDRMASAWLIRRFIDPEASFKFVPPRGYVPKPGELRFDMFDAEYTHEGELCTFQTLLARFGIADDALTIISEIVHDIDCKDDLFGRPETRGIAGILRGIAAANDDTERLARGAALFEDLYASFRRSRR